MVEIIFRGSKIQTGHRVKIPEPILDTLKLESGQKILIKFDVLKNEIIIKKDNDGTKKKK
jgi:hypothetical protein